MIGALKNAVYVAPVIPASDLAAFVGMIESLESLRGVAENATVRARLGADKMMRLDLQLLKEIEHERRRDAGNRGPIDHRIRKGVEYVPHATRPEH